MIFEFDAVVVGGGHAGYEAAHALHRKGLRAAMITLDKSKVGQMSCNPAIGGLGKTHLVREIDACGGIIAEATDLSGIQYRTLNSRKGASVQSLRTQCDRQKFAESIQKILQRTSIEIFEDEVVDLLIENQTVFGVEGTKRSYSAKTVILTTGTFLNGIMFYGDKQVEGGRHTEEASKKLAKRLSSFKLPMGRLKTGTPARIKTSTIDLSAMEEQPGETPTPQMSLREKAKHLPQISCFITRTNTKTHKIIAKNIQQSAMFSGKIKGIGPRYCPSIEDKVAKFPNKDSHQIFIEPEGLTVDLAYPNGISSSLPTKVQDEFIRTIKGLEDCEITNYGYAVEYDFVDPRALRKTLELKNINNLFLAGQINGTTGYEEAAAQGMVAGINAAQKILNEEEVFFERSNSYIGVLVDDLTNHGVTEPYRMFTSRAEHRLMLSQDNAEQRLTKILYEKGFVDNKHLESFKSKELAYEIFVQENHKRKVKIGNQTKQLQEALKNPQINKQDLLTQLGSTDQTNFERFANQKKYEGYIKRQQAQIEKDKKNHKKPIPNSLKYEKILGLSNEATEKLNQAKPETLGDAARLEGITPATISIISLEILKYEKTNLRKAKTKK